MPRPPLSLVVTQPALARSKRGIVQVAGRAHARVTPPAGRGKPAPAPDPDAPDPDPDLVSDTGGGGGGGRLRGLLPGAS